MSATATIADYRSFSQARSDARPLSLFERCTLGLGIFEVPLQIDRYFMFRNDDAEFGAVGGINVSISLLCFAALYVVWAFEVAARRQRQFGSVVVGFPMLTYILAAIFSLTAAAVPILSLFDICLMLQAYAMFFYLANRVRTHNDVIFCIVVLALTLIMQSLIVFGLAALGGRAAGQRFDIGPVALSVWEDGRIAGSMHSAVVAGSVMAFLWMPVMGLSLSDQRRWTWRIAMLATVFGLLAVFLTQTRGAVLTIATGSLWFGVAMSRRRWLPKWTLRAVVGLAVIGAVPLLAIVEKRIRSGDGGSAISRIHLSSIALEMLRDQPLFGVGTGNYHLAAQRYANQGKYRSEWYFTVHSKYLLVWVETGIFGLITFLCIVGCGIADGVRAWKTRDRMLAPLGLALSAGIVGHLVHMSVDMFNSRSLVQILWIVIGICAATYQVAATSSAHALRTRGAIDVA